MKEPKRFLRNRPRFQPMTYVLGARCSDGVVLVADKKVTSDSGATVKFESKIFWDTGIFIGYSGSDITNLNFRYDASQIIGRLKQTEKQVEVQGLVRELEDVLRKINTRYGERVLQTNDVLIAAKLRDPQLATLRYIAPEGAGSEILEYKAIGTGAPYGAVFLKRLWRNRNLTMNRVAEVGYFIIKYIETLGLDSTVGVGSERPQIVFLPNTGDAHEANEETLTRFENATKIGLEAHIKDIDKIVMPL